MHETVDGMLEEFEKAGISFQGCLYSFVFCLLIYAWSTASPGWACVLVLTTMSLVTAYFMLWRTRTVERTFPLYSIPLVSGAFFTKRSGTAARAQFGLDADAPAATPLSPPGSSGGSDVGPTLMADRAPALPPHIAQRHAPALAEPLPQRDVNQAQLVAEARARKAAKAATDRAAGKTRQKDSKWYQRLR